MIYYLKYCSQYLVGRKTVMLSDHAAFGWQRKTSKRIGQNYRWLKLQEEYNIVIIHRPGTQRGHADAISRIPCNLCGMRDDEDTGNIYE